MSENKAVHPFQKKRLSITHSFGSEHSDSSDGLLCAMDSPPRTPGLGLLASDKDRSSTPLSSGSEERQFVVKVKHKTYLEKQDYNQAFFFLEDGAHANCALGPCQ